MNGYIGYWKNKQFEVMADNRYDAQQKIIPIIQATTRKKVNGYEVSVFLAEKDGKQVIHSTTII